MNIIEYVENNGKYDFSEKPFCEVDGLVFSQLSYLKFEGIVKGPKNDDDGVVLSAIKNNEKYNQLYRDERYAKNNTSFFEALAASKRFGSIVINDFIDLIDNSIDVQFSAMTVTDKKDFRAVIFRGTDDNMVGWKEDLDMTFKMPIPAQKYSTDYLNRVADKIEGDFYVCGHSKGGNLSVYSSMNCKEEVRDRIIAIYSYDGPGFRTELLRNSSYDKIRDRIHKLVPKDCVIGMFGNMEKIEVCESIGLGGVTQHNPYNWVVDDFSFKRTEHLGKYSELGVEAVYLWASEMTDDQWALLSDKLFAVLEDAGITNLNDFYFDFFGTLAKVRESVEKLDDDSKAKIREMLSMFRESAAIIAKEESKVGKLKAEKEIKRAKKKTKQEASILKDKTSDKIKEAKKKVKEKTAKEKAVKEKTAKEKKTIKEKKLDKKYIKLN